MRIHESKSPSSENQHITNKSTYHNLNAIMKQSEKLIKVNCSNRNHRIFSFISRQQSKSAICKSGIFTSSADFLLPVHLSSSQTTSSIRRPVFFRLRTVVAQQRVAVSDDHQPMLAVHNEARASPQLLAAALEVHLRED